jgi:predicted protein tyrosine phosphatase
MIVSILSPGARLPVLRFGREPHYAVCCHDIEEPTLGFIMPSLEAVKGIIDRIRERRPDRLLVHCHAGLSRSPALGIAALAARGATAQGACEAVHAAAPEASPNRAILAYAGEVLGIDILSAASQVFTFSRGPRGATGPRLGLRMVRLDATQMTHATHAG